MNLRDTLNGSVQSQGIKVDVRAWLDMGSKEWQDTEPDIKARAYQAALVTGWTDQGLISFMTKEFAPRVDEEWAKLTLDTLRDCLKEVSILKFLRRKWRIIARFAVKR